MEKPIRPFLVILLVLLAMVISGGGTYWFINDQSAKEEASLQNQINDLDSQLSLLKGTSTTVDATADWKTYTNTTYGFTMKYPKDWAVSEVNISKSSPVMISTTDKNLGIFISSENYSKELGKDNFNEYALATAGDGPVLTYTNIKESIVNKQKIFRNQYIFMGGGNSKALMFQKNNKVITINYNASPEMVTAKNEDYTIFIKDCELILSSIQFTK